jgi:hypothetical protein
VTYAMGHFRPPAPQKKIVGGALDREPPSRSLQKPDRVITELPEGRAVVL